MNQKQRESELATNFVILLKEKIKDPEPRWSKVKTLLEGDLRYEALTNSELKEKLFREHVKNLLESRVNDFKNLLFDAAKMGKLTLQTPNLESIENYLRKDPRYVTVEKEDRGLIFQNFMKDLKKTALQAFKELLVESLKSGLISWKTKTNGPEFEKLNSLLKPDPRYSVLDPVPQEREKELIDYITNLKYK